MRKSMNRLLLLQFITKALPTQKKFQVQMTLLMNFSKHEKKKNKQTDQYHLTHREKRTLQLM
jgi:hypothetical protein